MTEERIAELRRIYAAFPHKGVLTTERHRSGLTGTLDQVKPAFCSQIFVDGRPTPLMALDNDTNETGSPTADFIIAAYTALPELLDEIERQWDRVAKLQVDLADMVYEFGDRDENGGLSARQRIEVVRDAIETLKELSGGIWPI